MYGLLRTKRTKKSPVQTKQERLYKFREYVKENKVASRYNIQKQFRWGDGVMERLHPVILSEYDYEVSWNAKARVYSWVGDFQQETLEKLK